MHAPTISKLLTGALLSLAATLSSAQVKIEAAWARPTVAGQQGGGGFLSITSVSADRLLGGSTPRAERFELHTMAMKGDVMEMRQIDAVELPAGKTVRLEPGGMHVMFIGLKAPLKSGSKVPVTLKFEQAGEVQVEFDIGPRPPAAAK